MAIGHPIETAGGPTGADRAPCRALVEGDALFLLVAGLGAAVVLAVVVGFVYLAGPTGLAVAAGAALPAALVAWLIERLTRPDDAPDER